MSTKLAVLLLALSGCEPVPPSESISPLRYIAPTPLLGYHGGRGMRGATTVSFIWYGNWPSCTGRSCTQSILNDLVSRLGASDYFKILDTYWDSAGWLDANLVLGLSTIDPGSQGTRLHQESVTAEEIPLSRVVEYSLSHNLLPVSDSTIYVVVTADGISMPGGCGYHSNYPRPDGTSIKFAWVRGDNNGCEGVDYPTTIYSPNGNPAADRMASWLAHELMEAVSDPEFWRGVGAWYTGPVAGQGELSDPPCQAHFDPIQLGYTYYWTPYLWNVQLGDRQYLLQQQYVNIPGVGCALRNPLPRRFGLGPPTVATPPGGAVEVMAVGSDGALYRNTVPSVAWERVSARGLIPWGTKVAAIRDFPPYIDIFSIAANGSVRWDDVFYGGSGLFFATVAGVAKPGTVPAAVVTGPDNLEVFVMGPNNEIKQMSRNGTVTTISPPGWIHDKSDITAVIRGDVIYLFVVDFDGKVFTNERRSGVWGGWIGISGSGTARPGTTPTAVVRPGVVDVFVVDTTRKVRHIAYSSPATIPWPPFWDAVSDSGLAADHTDVVAVSRDDSHVALFVADGAGTVRTVEGNTSWTGTWNSVGAFAAPPSATPAVVSTDSTHMDLFINGTDLGGYANHFVGSSWGGWTPIGP